MRQVANEIIACGLPTSVAVRVNACFENQVRGILVVCASLLLFSLPDVGASQTPAEQHADLQFLAERDALVPAKELWVGIRFSLKDGFHTYWLNPGDSGEAPRIEWHVPANLQLGAIRWPQPTRLVNPPFADYGYQHEVLLMAVVTASPGLANGQMVNLGASVHYLICRELCIPGRKELSLTLPVRDRATRSTASQLFRTARDRLPQRAPAPWKLTALDGANELVLSLTSKEPPRSAQFFPLEPEQIENGAPQIVTTKPGGIRLHLMKSKHLLKPAAQLEGVLVVNQGKAYEIKIPVSRPLGKTAAGQKRSSS